MPVKRLKDEETAAFGKRDWPWNGIRVPWLISWTRGTSCDIKDRSERNINAPSIVNGSKQLHNSRLSASSRPEPLGNRPPFSCTCHVHGEAPLCSTYEAHESPWNTYPSGRKRKKGGQDAPITPKLLPTPDPEICGRRVTYEGPEPNTFVQFSTVEPGLLSSRLPTRISEGQLFLFYSCEIDERECPRSWEIFIRVDIRDVSFRWNFLKKIFFDQKFILKMNQSIDK